jgi:hypothetical protein
MKEKYGRNIGVVSCNSSVIEKVIYMSENSFGEANCEIHFHSGKAYKITGSAASDIFSTFALAVSNNESIGQWFNRDVKHHFELVGI